ncbi:MAG: DUF547 domain-containing protein [Alphaproteobacteria bacterium]|nr:DUF547 domain-containing protein [Alphaproteobacteria bacterium]
MLLRAGVTATLPLSAMAAPKPEPWPRWQAQDPASARRIDHGAWDGFLKRHVVAGDDGIHRLAYARVAGADKAALDAYLSMLAGTAVGALARDEQRAFWINLYNALTVQVVLGAYPVRSIRDIRISPGLFAAGPWGKKLVTIEGERLSLDDIEHRILRPIWNDPRTHYAVNCASIGCPNLPRDAFTAATMEVMLDSGARAYVNHPRGASLRDGRLTTSSIYAWFKEDFGGTDATVIAHLRRFAAPSLARALGGVDRIAGDAYDWALNDAGSPGG